MDNNPDSPDSLSGGGDQLTVDLLSPRTKRRRMVINDLNDVDNRRDQSTPDINNKSTNNNNNDVGFVLMDDGDHQEQNGTEEEDEVCILI